MELKLNSCQQKTLNNLINWYLGKEKSAILHGKAGTGKTFLTKAFLEKLKGIRCFIGAETNEAVSVIANATNHKHTYGTVCNLLCLHLGFEKHEKVLKQFAEPNVENFDLIIIDEGSMLDKFKLELLIKLNKKILFIGHKSQLPPILQNVSLLDKCLPPLFEMDFPAYELKTVERNKGALLDFCNLAEDSIYSGAIILPESFRIRRKYLTEEFFENPAGLAELASLNTSILCYTNNRVEKYNVLFRKQYFGSLLAERYDFLEADKIILKSPTAAFVKDISRCRGISSILQKNNVVEILPTNTKAEVLKINEKNVLDMPCYLLKIKAQLMQNEIISYIYVPQDEESFLEFKNSYYHAALYEKIPHLAEKKWKLYHDIEKVFGNTKHAYARTVHTAQGSTIKNVIVDDGDVDKCQNIFLRRKLRYVAYSRAQNNLMRVL